MTATQTATWDRDAAIDEQEDALLTASADDARHNDPRGWLTQIPTVTVTQNGDTWFECADCGVPEDEMCAWCGCDCQRIRGAARPHPECVWLGGFDKFLTVHGA